MSTLTEDREKKRKKAVRERRRKLTQEHLKIIDWLACIDDNIVLGNDDEATDFIKILTGYTERLVILLGERQQRRLNKRRTKKIVADETISCRRTG
jgi:hypothetical protein